VSKKALTHGPAACSMCECLPSEVYRRHWKHEPKAGYWHVIADGPDLITRLPRQAHFVTVLSYRLLADGARHYQGSWYWEHDADDAAQALEDLRRCLEVLDVEYDLPLEVARSWHSGGRGFHITIPPAVLGAEAGHPRLPRIYAAMIEQLFPPSVASTLDRSVYNMRKGRMWRMPNRRRSDTGRYKVPLAMREVLHRLSAELEALTHRPRYGRYWPEDGELSPCPALVRLYRQTAATVQEVPPRPKVSQDCERIPAGRRNDTLTSMAGAMRREGMSEAAIVAALMAENRQRCDPPLPEEEVTRIAVSIARYRPALPVAVASRASHESVVTRGGMRTIAATEVLAWRG
jgi:hypothetical protein